MQGCTVATDGAGEDDDDDDAYEAEERKAIQDEPEADPLYIPLWLGRRMAS